MPTSSLFNPVGPYALTNPPGVPPEVGQMATLLERQVQQLLTETAHYSLLIAGLVAMPGLVAASLLLHRLWPGISRFFTGPNRGPATHRQVRRLPANTRIAAANQKALRTLSARLRAGQLSN